MVIRHAFYVVCGVVAVVFSLATVNRIVKTVYRPVDAGLTWRPGKRTLNYTFVSSLLFLIGITGLFLPGRLIGVFVLSMAGYVEVKRREYRRDLHDAGGLEEHLQRCIIQFRLIKIQVKVADEMQEQLAKLHSNGVRPGRSVGE
jgi:hypothetical protein